MLLVPAAALGQSDGLGDPGLEIAALREATGAAQQFLGVLAYMVEHEVGIDPKLPVGLVPETLCLDHDQLERESAALNRSRAAALAEARARRGRAGT